MKALRNLLKITSHANRKRVILIAFLNCKIFGFLPLSLIKHNNRNSLDSIHFEYSLMGWLCSAVQFTALCLLYNNGFTNIDLTEPASLHQGLGFAIDIISHSIKLVITLYHIKILKLSLNSALQTLSAIVQLDKVALIPYIPVLFHAYNLIIMTLFSFSAADTDLNLLKITNIFVDMSRNCVDYLSMTLCYVVYISFSDINNEISKINVNNKNKLDYYQIYKLNILMDRHWSTSILMTNISYCFGVYFFLERFAAVLRMVLTCYIVYYHIVNHIINKTTVIATGSSITKTFFFHYFIGMLNDYIIYVANRANHKLQNLAMNCSDRVSSAVIQSFMLRVGCQETCLSACGYFQVSRLMAGKLVLSTITLFVVIVQFDSSPDIDVYNMNFTTGPATTTAV